MIKKKPNKGKIKNTIISTCWIKTPSAGPARHLNILRGQEGAELLAVVLANAVKDDGARRHIHAHREGLRREEEFDPAVGEAALHHLL